MPKGIWVWPPDPRGQRKVLGKVSSSPHLMAALAAIGKSKDGMSNAELDDAISSSSEWTTLWVIRQLTSLGFVDFKVDLFGNPAKYSLTEAGKTALSMITGQPPQKTTPAVRPPPSPPPTTPTPPMPPSPQAAAPLTT